MSQSLFAPAVAWGPRRLLHTPALRAFLFLSAVFYLFVWYGKNNFYRDPGSVWYDDSRAFKRDYSAFREWQSRQWLEDTQKLVNARAGGQGDMFIKGNTNATICASFLTVPRAGTEPYVEVAIASALDHLTPSERRDMHLSVFFATTRTHEHSSYGKPWLREVLDEVYDYNSILSPGDLDHATELEEANDGLRKAPYDYTLPMRHCLDTGAKYIAIFEDDIILSEGWMARTILGLRDVEKKMKDSKRKNEWLFLRLFNQERSIGWGSRSLVGNNAPIISVLIGFGLAMSLNTLRRRFRALKPHLDNWTIIIISCIFTPAFVVLFFQSGKASLLPPGAGVKEEDFGCCAQALVFNRLHVEGLVEYLYMRRHDGYHDMITREFARIQELARWAQYPVMAQHVGSVSSIQKMAGESSHVWSMAFELLNPMLLSRQHAQMVKTVYGNDAEYVIH